MNNRRQRRPRRVRAFNSNGRQLKWSYAEGLTRKQRRESTKQTPHFKGRNSLGRKKRTQLQSKQAVLIGDTGLVVSAA